MSCFLTRRINKGLVTDDRDSSCWRRTYCLLRTEASLYIESELEWEALSLPVSPSSSIKSTRAGLGQCLIWRGMRPTEVE
jgi:hypothetical protein